MSETCWKQHKTKEEVHCAGVANMSHHYNLFRGEDVLLTSPYEI